MEHFIKFLEKINTPSDVIAGLKEGKVEDIDAAATTYLKAREDYYLATIDKKKIGDDAIAGYHLTLKKDLNRTLNLGLSNADIDKFKTIDEFYTEVSAKVKAAVDEARGSTDATLKADLAKWQETASERQKRIDELEGGYDGFKTKIETEKQEFERTFKAKEYFRKMVAADETIVDVPHKAAAIETIENQLFGKYRIHEDGTVFNLDGSKVVDPTRQVTITHVRELFEPEKPKWNLLKQSNTGQTPKAFKADGSAVDTSEKAMSKINQLRNEAAPMG